MYNLYLTPLAASFLARSDLATVTAVRDKLIAVTTSLADADYLTVEASPAFESLPLQFTNVRRNLYLVFGPNLRECVNLLSEHASIYSITLSKQFRYFNRFAAGYSLANTKAPDGSGDLPRVLELKGLNGSGVVVTVLDSYLDRQSTFFADPNV
jgi:hypothetical protein